MAEALYFATGLALCEMAVPPILRLDAVNTFIQDKSVDKKHPLKPFQLRRCSHTTFITAL